MVYTVHMVYTADMVYTVDRVYAVDMVYTVDMWTWGMRGLRGRRWLRVLMKCTTS